MSGRGTAPGAGRSGWPPPRPCLQARPALGWKKAPRAPRFASERVTKPLALRLPQPDCRTRVAPPYASCQPPEDQLNRGQMRTAEFSVDLQLAGCRRDVYPGNKPPTTVSSCRGRCQPTPAPLAPHVAPWLAGIRRQREQCRPGVSPSGPAWGQERWAASVPERSRSPAVKITGAWEADIQARSGHRWMTQARPGLQQSWGEFAPAAEGRPQRAA